MAKSIKFDSIKFIERHPEDFVLISKLLAATLWLNDREMQISLRNLADRMGIPFKTLSRHIDRLLAYIRKCSDTENDTLFDTAVDTVQKVVTICNLVFYNFEKDRLDTMFDTVSDTNVRRKEPKEEINKENNISSDKSSENIMKEKADRFVKPTIQELSDYFLSIGSNLNEAQSFYYFYDSKNWMVGKNKMKSWKSAASGWHSRNKSKYNNRNNGANFSNLVASTAAGCQRELERERIGETQRVSDEIF